MCIAHGMCFVCVRVCVFCKHSSRGCLLHGVFFIVVLKIMMMVMMVVVVAVVAVAAMEGPCG